MNEEVKQIKDMIKSREELRTELTAMSKEEVIDHAITYGEAGASGLHACLRELRKQKELTVLSWFFLVLWIVIDLATK